MSMIVMFMMVIIMMSVILMNMMVLICFNGMVFMVMKRFTAS
ncbi:hypothetical protein OFO16_12895 [Vibrio natriegens]|nr:hypothetical protein [Vibrio natriegens]UYI46692.1 hypothetical protein OFO16_12895 [Vibrio natriegens]